MENQEVMEDDGVLDGYVKVSPGDAFEQIGLGENGCEHLGDELLVDLESYLDDINDRLTISRLVSDSVIKGLVTAVEQEAADKIAAKEKEVANLKEVLKLQQIDGTRGRSLIPRINSGSELSRLGGVLQERESESLVDVDRTLYEWYWEKDLMEKLEAMVIRTSIQKIMEEREQSLWTESVWFSDSQQSADWEEKFSQISNIRMELDAILKSLSHSETGQLTSHGSNDTDHFHRRALSSSITSLSLWDGNGKLEGSRADVPENFEAAQLKHLSKEDLVCYFNSIITKMRRDHESTVQELTEEFFSLKREYLKERGSSIPHKKDKGFDALRKSIADVTHKLDDFLLENEKPPASTTIDAEGFYNSKDRLNQLLSENHQLRESLMDKNEELKFLSSQLSVAEEKLQHSVTEANMLNMIGDLNSDLTVAHIETVLIQDIYNCTLREMIQDVHCQNEESDLQSLQMQEIYDVILNGAVVNAEIESTCGIEDCELERLIGQGTSEVIFRETLKDAEEELKQLCGKYLVESQNRTALEKNILEKENLLASEAEHAERLKQEIVVLTKSLEEKKKFVIDITTTLTREREQLEIATQELYKSREYAKQQQILVSQSSKELEFLKSRLEGALLQIDEDKVNICKLNEKVEQTLQDLEETDEQRKIAVALSQEKKNSFLMVESKENELRKQMEAVTADIQGMLKILGDFESKVAGQIKAISVRFEDSVSQLSPLLKKVKLLKKTGHLYQQKLERRCADLQMAEAEVDLLGDEVDKLLILLEKIFISLDHYSPVLQHYPGVVEILKLIRRELTGESMKPTQFSPC